MPAPRSCYHLKKLDVRKSGMYLIDPDGPDHGDPPFEAECDMKTGEKYLYALKCTFFNLYK